MYNSPENVTTPRNPFLHHPFMVLPSPPPSPPLFCGGTSDDEFPRRNERFSQWSYEETRDFIEIRAQLEWNFNTTRRNKNLWEIVANRMRDKGYRRTVDQCKWKWKNLVSRYKGQQASDPDSCRQCPFFNELHALFAARDSTMQQAQLISEDDEETNTDAVAKGTVALKIREKRQKIDPSEKNPMQTPKNVNNNESVVASLQKMLGNFIEQQKRVDMQWKATMERRAQEMEVCEHEWRQKMEKLEREKIMMERAWREKEEQRRLREEIRAQKTDALLTTLVNKLTGEENR